MKIEESQLSLQNARGQRLQTYAYIPNNILAVLVFHHGFGEYAGREGMPDVFRAWASQGIAVHTYDAHGHGLSEPQEEYDRFLVWDFNHIVDDLVMFASTTRKLYGKDMPMFLGGHSMGSLASIHVALRDQTLWQGLVLGTATVDVEWNWTLRCQASIGSILAMLIPRAKIVPASVDDTLEVKEPRIPTDPLLCAENVRCRTANELLKAFAHVQAHGHKLSLPIYCHHGTNDKLASIKAVKGLLQRCASQDISFHEIVNGPHELFLSSDSQTVTDLISEWVQYQIGAKATDASRPQGLRPLVSSPVVTGHALSWSSADSSPLESCYGDSPQGCSPTARAGPHAFTEHILLQEAS